MGRVLEDLRQRIIKENGAKQTEKEGQGDYRIPKKLGPVGYYDPNQLCYWMENGRKEWQRTNEGHLKRFLRQRTYKGCTKGEGQDSMIENHLIELQLNYDVAYAGPLAGWNVGLHDICGNRVLVTKGARPIFPHEGKWSVLEHFLADLLPDNQHLYFYAWLKSSCRSLKQGAPFRPGQCLALAGPPGCGKSLLQNLITEVFGGRACKPYKFIQGKTDFNSEHLGCEHLMIEDEAASTDIRIRRDMGSAIKSLLVNETQTCYRKNKEPLMLMPFWRLTVSLNDEAENLMVLPPLDDSLKDKILLLKCGMHKQTIDSDDLAKKREWRITLSNELPHFLHWLKTWKIPTTMQDSRYGCVAWQHPELLDALEDLSPEMKLMSLIDTLQIWNADRMPWVGTANQLEDKLLEKDKLGRTAKLLSFNTACGVYLARLAKRFPDRVKCTKRIANKVTWTINPLAEEPLPE